MNYLFSLLFCLTLLTQTATAQNGQQRIEAAKIGLITNRLNLTPDQAQGFWAVYNEYNGQKRELNRKIRQIGNETTRQNMAESDVIANLKEANSAKQQLANLDDTYMSKFLKVISAQQLAELYKTERDFNKILLNKLGNQE